MHQLHVEISFAGVKTFVNEFAAYDELGKLIDNKISFYNWTENYNRTWGYTGDLDITFYPDDNFNTTDVLLYGYLEVSFHFPNRTNLNYKPQFTIYVATKIIFIKIKEPIIPSILLL